VNTSSNALCEQCRVLTNLECWISDIRQVERSLSSARLVNKGLARPWTFLDYSPTLGGPK